MAVNWPVPIEGGYACGRLRYRLEESPMFIHCCNCQECQRQNGTAFALNAFIETEKVVQLPPQASDTSVDAGATITQPLHVLTPSHSGTGQLVARCPRCFTAVWSYYSGGGPHTRFIRVGTVDKFSADGRSLDKVLKPNAYIFTKYSMPWVQFPTAEKEAEQKVVDEFYDPADVWPQEVKDRWAKILPRVEKWRADKDWKKCKDLHVDVDATVAPQAEKSLEERARSLKL